jgi:hypothetical protein
MVLRKKPNNPDNLRSETLLLSLQSWLMTSVNLLVFRDTGQETGGAEELRRLRNVLEKIENARAENAILDGLVTAGAFESALSDCNWPSANAAMGLTDTLAEALLQPSIHPQSRIRELLTQFDGCPMPPRLRITTPEGFAYYALHPLDFDACSIVAERAQSFAIVGIRSIGTVLSAVLAAALRVIGKSVARLTVRPMGHPYDRILRLNVSETSWVTEHKERDSVFVIVDEGPGLSGSSFLATAEALASLGVDRQRIVMLGTRPVDPQQLCARDAAARWRQFMWCKADSTLSRRFSHLRSMGVGDWRRTGFRSESEWPACWPEMERLKFLSEDGHHLFKFDGFGSLGEKVRTRSAEIFRAGFGSGIEYAGDGMAAYVAITGMAAPDISQAVLARVADYCAFRATEFKAPPAAGSNLEQMARFNFSQEFGEDLRIPPGSLDPSCPVIPDGRMQPHEWIAADSNLLKVDGASHGDDHFYPGPTDIAWDLAGTIIEWKLNTDQSRFLLRKFRDRSGIRSDAQLPHFLLAYTIFRMAYCKMAIPATQVSPEKARLERAYRYYRSRAYRLSRCAPGQPNYR